MEEYMTNSVHMQQIEENMAPVREKLVWDYAQSKVVKASELVPGSQRAVASEQAKYDQLHDDT